MITPDNVVLCSGSLPSLFFTVGTAAKTLLIRKMEVHRYLLEIILNQYTSFHFDCHREMQLEYKNTVDWKFDNDTLGTFRKGSCFFPTGLIVNPAAVAQMTGPIFQRSTEFDRWLLQSTCQTNPKHSEKNGS